MAGSSDHISRVADSLIQIEIELRQLGVWEKKPPPAEALQSSQPFGIDQLEFTQWLQFVFISRMKVLIEAERPLPAVSGMAPMAEEHFRAREESGQRLIRELAEMDRLLSGKS
ncbi:YqcC family protein [Marinobacter confluentis]|uniref:YqcC family protein n=1 Tax=Marinobacter confluentis TaxID=1697557 RepID=A0A4Z1BPL9_9GAMM|nr:YqcC family protein [Marinobacter confluentis]TGN41937.1 YqcC family protein [Marinobacter confluentis]